MASSSTAPRRLVADIGGTYSRLALYDPGSDTLRAWHKYRNSEQDRFEDIIAHWLQGLDEPAPRDCCLAVAAPPHGDRVTLLNIDWSFSRSELAQRFAFSRLGCINDFQGNAYALPHLTDRDLVVLDTGRNTGGKLATVGPGTGLGGATLEQVTGMPPQACACEPGHMGLAAATALELELFRALQPEYKEVFAELLLSGPGLRRLYRTMAKVQGKEAQPLTQEDISVRALSGECELCVATLDTFCALLGSICGDFVLANGAYGGLYLAGGIVPDIIPFIEASCFARRFQAKGNMCEHLAAVPLYAITSGVAGLLGASHAPL